MSTPPRLKPRAVAPAQPYPPASDYDPPVDVETGDPEPFLLTRTARQGEPVTNDQLSEQLGALSSHIQVVHREVSLTRQEVADLRTLVTTDHAQRITEVERRVPITIPPGLRKGALYTALVTAWPLVEALIPVARGMFEGGP